MSEEMIIQGCNLPIAEEQVSHVPASIPSNENCYYKVNIENTIKNIVFIVNGKEYVLAVEKILMLLEMISSKDH